MQTVTQEVAATNVIADSIVVTADIEEVKTKKVKQNKKGVIKIFQYGRTPMKFVEQNAKGEFVKAGTFMLPERTQRVIVNDKAVVVILQDGSKGLAICGRKDTFSETKGIQIAYTRAKIESLKKELALMIYA